MSNLMNLRKFISPEIIFGNGARFLAGKYALQFSSLRAHVVTEPGLMGTEWLKDVKGSLETFNIDYSIFSDISSNPRAAEVMEGVKVYREEACMLTNPQTAHQRDIEK